MQRRRDAREELLLERLLDLKTRFLKDVNALVEASLHAASTRVQAQFGSA